MPAVAHTVVLLPGLDGTGELFSDLVALLQEHLETHVIRYPVSEDLSYSDLLALVEAQLPRGGPFVVVAESFSVPVVILWAAKNPPNLKGLIFCAGFAASPVRGLKRSLLRAFAPILFKIAPPGFMLRLLLVGCGAPRFLVSSLQSAISSVQPRVMASRFKAVLNCDVRNQLQKIDVPILYLRAQHDRVIPSSCGQEIAKMNSHCKIVKIRGPHLICQRNPTASADAIIQFMKDLENK